MDEEDNVEIIKLDEVENEIMQINEELNELKGSSNLSIQNDDSGENFDEETLENEEGGNLDFIDAFHNDADDTFYINLGKFKLKKLNVKVKVSKNLFR
jgi:hypothetical protein